MASPDTFVTVFRDKSGTLINAARLMDLEEIERVIRKAPAVADKTSLPLLKLASFGLMKSEKGSLRHDANVEIVHGVEGDYDGELVPMEQAAETLSKHGVAAVLYTSARHTEETPRWRVLVPLARPLEGDTSQLQAQRRHWTGVLNALLGGILTAESFVLSQCYFFGPITGKPTPEIIRLSGCCLDELEEIPKPIYPAHEASARTENGSQTHYDSTTDADLLAVVASNAEIAQRLGGLSRYEAMLKVSARRASLGLGADDIEAVLLQALGDSPPPFASNGNDPRREAAAIAQSAVRKYGESRRPAMATRADSTETESPVTVLLTAARTAMLADLNAGEAAIDAATAPDFVSNPVLPICGASLCAPGGTGKTALVLGEKVRVACGGTLYGHDVDMQGPCVLVSAEDGSNRVRYILQQVLQDGIESGELPERAAIRAKSEVKVIGWNRARWGPVVSADRDGNMQRTAVFDLLLELLAAVKPVYVTLDPAVLFGPGERFGNDADAFLASLLHDSALSIKATMQLIDHVSQNVARTGIIDQYAARGGTAKTDNARLARQLIRVEAASGIIVPPAITADDLAQGRLLQLHWTKSNFGRGLPPPAYLLRRRFWMRYVRTPTAEAVAGDAEQKARQRDADQLETNTVAVVEFVRQQLLVGTGIRMSQRDVANAEPGPRAKGEKISRDNRRGAIQRALADGRLKYLPLPDEERQGSRTQYLAPADYEPPAQEAQL